jgi:hypothetical protein
LRFHQGQNLHGKRALAWNALWLKFFLANAGAGQFQTVAFAV